jgi:EAL domain-containing protein (putative c-di-GMP-specific phosphodiesterase class I)
VAVAIDDFGTGYSSLDYLRRFPTDRIKIAHTFVRHLEPVGGDAAIVKATLGLARELGIEVIAEGVETQAQLDLLRDWGCGEGQGFYFAKPLDAQDVARLFAGGGDWRGPDWPTSLQFKAERGRGPTWTITGERPPTPSAPALRAGS